MTESGRGVARSASLFLAANILFGSGLFFHAFLYNFYLDRLGLSAVVLGNAAAALTAGGLLTLLPAGWLMDRIGARAGLLVAGVVGAAGLGAGALTTTPAGIYAAAALAGAGNAFWRVTQAPTLVALAPPGQRSRLFSLNVALIIGSGAVGMAVAGATPAWLERTLHVDPLAAIRMGLGLGAVCTALSVILYAAVRVRSDASLPEGAANTPLAEPEGPAAPHRVVLVAVALVGLWMFGPALGAPFLNLFFFKNHGLPVERVGAIFALASGGWAFAVFFSGELARRFGLSPVVTFWLALYGPAVLLLGAGGLGLALACFFLQGLAQPAANPLIDQVLMERSAPGKRGSVSSWRNVAADLSAMAGASAGGWLVAKGSFSLLFGVAGVVGMATTIPLVVALRRLHAGSASPAP